MREWARAHHCMPALTSMLTRYRDSGKWTGKAKYADVQRTKGMADIGAIVLEGCESLLFVQVKAPTEGGDGCCPKATVAKAASGSRSRTVMTAGVPRAC